MQGSVLAHGGSCLGLIGALALIGHVCHGVLMESLGNHHSASTKPRDSSKAEASGPALAGNVEGDSRRTKKKKEKHRQMQTEATRGQIHSFLIYIFLIYLTLIFYFCINFVFDIYRIAFIMPIFHLWNSIEG